MNGGQTSEEKSEKDLFYVVSMHLVIMLVFYYSLGLYAYLIFLYCVLALFPLVDALRTLIDHRKSINSDSMGYTRNFKISFFDKFLTKTYFDWHLLHHLYPQIPQSNLRIAERIIVPRMRSYYNSGAANSWGALKESLTKRDLTINSNTLN